ncbi:hypothetical protein [Microbulbifer hydrolyticus]|uniref:Universal stress protein B n=1 Tax=Microbulbifer hydrolyticus TaxID=48074 RepID=A0A6P1TFP9_9GAMM|nr:hypothetical protein [Microbulbifer hydrolyticus]MBB5213101.1 hypothetical protein [Microbulbifer hydrolyticus]QHQ40455.1 hypothetical protein GTQ55_16720 [Microbulbifer hydrolyticus]
MTDLVPFIAVWIGLVFSLYCHSRFLSQLKLTHPMKFKELGSPSIFTKYPIFGKSQIVKDLSRDSSLTKYAEFMRKSEWNKMGDSRLKKFARYRLYAQVLSVVSFLFLIATWWRP